MKTVLFVCQENANRSQMAEAFATVHGKDVLQAWSAGSKPAGKVNPRAVKAMAEKGYDLRLHSSKALDEVPRGPYDFVITMGCGDACPFVAAHVRGDWEIPDPAGMAPEAFNEVRDEIERKVIALVNEIRRAEPYRMHRHPG